MAQDFSWALIKEILTPKEDIKPTYNLAPSQNAFVIRLDSNKQVSTDSLRWGLIPSWAKDTKIAFSLINARAESITEKPSFKAALLYPRNISLINDPFLSKDQITNIFKKSLCKHN